MNSNTKIVLVAAAFVLLVGASLYFGGLSGANTTTTSTTTLKTTTTLLTVSSTTSSTLAAAANGSAEDAALVVGANNQFAFDLYQSLRKDPDNLDNNLFFSPYSIFSALAMTGEGARDKTRQEMEAVLHLPKDENAARSGFASVMAGINGQGKDYKLSVANALWAQNGFPFLKEYFDLVGSYYGGRVTNLDFVGNSEGARVTINGWVEAQTNDKIKDLIPPGVLTPMTRLVLTNAVYFKGDWAKQFNIGDTRRRDFTVSEGETVKVDMMQLTGDKARFPYAETDEFQALELPYKGDEISMMILLPKGGLASLEESISRARYDEIRGMLRSERVDVYVPRFKLETKSFLAPSLKRMGMSTAFSAAADFSGMTGKKDLQIDEVIHQAYVDVNENGTEAAAATAVIMKLTAIRPENPPKVFNADHPFIFLIAERKTGNILFMGRVMRPPAGSQNAQTTTTTLPQIIGGDRDEHGCLIAAGYSWNDTALKCMRLWSGEVQSTGVCGGCPQFMPASPNFCLNGTIVGGQVDECGCVGPPRCLSAGSAGYLAGKINIGPLCPVERNPPDPRCQPTEETYMAHKLIVSAGQDPTLMWVFYGGADGAYKLALPAGEYTVRSEQTSRIGSFGPVDVTVSAGKTTELDIDIDTGIR